MEVMTKALVEVLIKSNNGDIQEAIENMRDEIKTELEPQIRAQLIVILTPIVAKQITMKYMTPEKIAEIEAQALEAATKKQSAHFHDTVVNLATSIKALNTNITIHLEKYVPKAGEETFDDTKRHMENIVDETNALLRTGTFCIPGYSSCPMETVDDAKCKYDYDNNW